MFANSEYCIMTFFRNNPYRNDFISQYKGSIFMGMYSQFVNTTPHHVLLP